MPSSEKTNASHEVSDDILRLHNPDCHDIQHPEKSSNNSNNHFKMRTPDSVDKYADLLRNLWLKIVRIGASCIFLRNNQIGSFDDTTQHCLDKINVVLFYSHILHLISFCIAE